MIDIAVAYPREGAICLQSRYLFSNPENESCQLFLQLLSAVMQVQQLAVTAALQVAEIFYCPKNSSRRQTLNAIRRCLTGPAPANGARKRNGSAVNGSSPTVNGRQPVRWRPNAKGEI